MNWQNTNSPADQHTLDVSSDIPWLSASAAAHTCSAAELASAGNYWDLARHQVLFVLTTKHHTQVIKTQNK